MLKYFHIVAVLLFLTMALIQFNDPDPLYWVVVYLTVAFIAAAHCFSHHLIVLSMIVAGMVLAGLLTSLPGFVDYLVAEDHASIFGQTTNKKPYIESVREFGGLIIAAIYLGLCQLSVSYDTKA